MMSAPPVTVGNELTTATILTGTDTLSTVAETLAPTPRSLAVVNALVAIAGMPASEAAT